ncbi:hypothetical protein VRB34_01265 [Erwinia aphidicola]|uniref:hypothetical protein n=1 Tax=Erwinia aphidicola TaxID=68334 RepID=UPI0030D3738E
MSLSSSLRSKMRNERDAAIALDKAVSGVKDNINSTASDVYSGVERLSWYSSCFLKNTKTLAQTYLQVINVSSSLLVRYTKEPML